MAQLTLKLFNMYWDVSTLLTKTWWLYHSASTNHVVNGSSKNQLLCDV